jgi:hypothetical protein
MLAAQTVSLQDGFANIKSLAALTAKRSIKLQARSVPTLVTLAPLPPLPPLYVKTTARKAISE